MQHQSTTPPLYLGIGGHVLAITPATGEELWRTKLASGKGLFTGIHVQGDMVLATIAGELWCLEADTGAIRWHNKLKGLGSGFISFGSAAEGSAAANASADQAATVAATTAAVVATTAG